MNLKEHKELICWIVGIIVILIFIHVLWPVFWSNKEIKESGISIKQSEIAEYQYVAAAYRINITGLRQSFHQPDCKWAKEIKSNNLLRFKSRKEAIQSGRKPCKVCKP